LPEFPGGNAALYIINRLLDRAQNQGNPLGNRAWDRVSDDVNHFLKDSLSASSLRNIGGRLEGFRTSFDHCQTSTTGTAKTRCLHGVFLSMIEAEGTFKGRSSREKSLLLKYFDRFTILFNAVTEKFKTSYASHPPQNGTINIDRTFRQRQCSFYRYQCEALANAREFACRDLYVTLFDSTPLLDRDLGYRVPPQRCYDINSNKKRSTLLKGNHSLDISSEGSLEKRKGCGFFQKSRSYQAWLYNSTTEDYIWESRTEEACSREEAVKKLWELCRRGLVERSRRIQPCKNYVKADFEDDLVRRLREMRRMGNCASVKYCQ